MSGRASRAILHLRDYWKLRHDERQSIIKVRSLRRKLFVFLSRCGQGLRLCFRFDHTTDENDVIASASSSPSAPNFPSHVTAFPAVKPPIDRRDIYRHRPALTFLITKCARNATRSFARETVWRVTDRRGLANFPVELQHLFVRCRVNLLSPAY